MSVAVEMVTAIVEILILSIYLKGLYQKYVRSTPFIWVAYIVNWLVLCAFSVFPVFPIVRLGYAAISFIVMAKLLFDAKWIYAFYSALLLCAINIIADVVTGSLIVLFGIPAENLSIFSNSRILYIVASKLILFFCVMLVIRLSTWRKTHDSLINAVPLLLCQVFSIFILNIMFIGAYNAETTITWAFIIGAVGVLYINIIIFLYVERIKEVSEMKRQNQLAELQYQSKVAYFAQVQEDQKKTRALWHDIKKYLNTMNELISRNDILHAQECIGQVSELFMDVGNVVDVGNTVVSAVLNHSVQKARQLGVETELDIRVQPDLNISAADLSVIIGNTFDNAMEACGRLPGDKKIAIQLIQKDAILFYEISNPYDKNMKVEKDDPKLHGFGLRNVKRCIDKYNGTMTIDTGGSEFVVSIHMNIPDDESAMPLVS